MKELFSDKKYFSDPFFLESVQGKENFSLTAGKNYFTIIAPTFGEANDMTLFSIGFLAYMNELSKQTQIESGRPSRGIILDIINSYGKIHNWPDEIVKAESKLKMGICRDISSELGLEFLTFEDMCTYESDPRWTSIEGEVIKRFNLESTSEDIELARQTSYDKSKSDEQLALENRNYGIKRWTEFTYMTKIMNAWTIKQSKPKFDEAFDVSLDEKNVPKIYVPKQIDSKIFRPKKDDPSFGMSTSDIVRLTDGLNPNSQITKYLSKLGAIVSACYAGDNPIIASNKSFEDSQVRDNVDALIAFKNKIQNKYS